MPLITTPKVLDDKVEHLTHETFNAKVFYAADGSEALIVQVGIDQTSILSVDGYGQVCSTLTGPWEEEPDV
jgi:hypothetical protein